MISDQKQDNEILSPSAAARLLGVSRSTFYKMVKQSDPPPPRKLMLSTRRRGYFRHELLTWVSMLGADRR